MNFVSFTLDQIFWFYIKLNSVEMGQ